MRHGGFLRTGSSSRTPPRSPKWYRSRSCGKLHVTPSWTASSRDKPGIVSAGLHFVQSGHLELVDGERHVEVLRRGACYGEDVLLLRRSLFETRALSEALILSIPGTRTAVPFRSRSFERGAIRSRKSAGSVPGAGRFQKNRKGDRPAPFAGFCRRSTCEPAASFSPP